MMGPTVLLVQRRCELILRSVTLLLSSSMRFGLSLSETLLIEHLEVHLREMNRRNACTGHQIRQIGTKIGINHRRAEHISDVLQRFSRDSVNREDTGLTAFGQDNHFILRSLNRNRAAHGNVVEISLNEPAPRSG